MDEQVTGAFDLEAMIGRWIRLVGIGIDMIGVLIIVAGIARSTSRIKRPVFYRSRWEGSGHPIN